MKLNLRAPLAVFDLETTGLNPSQDRIVEISILKVQPNGDKEVKTLKLNPTVAIPLECSMIHGIYAEDIKDAPTFREVAKELEKFLEGCDIGGFNVLRFDLPMLVEEFYRVDIHFDISKRKIVDAQKIFHLMEPRSLTAAFKYYCDGDLTNAHSAEADTLATFDVIEAQVLKYEGQEIKDKEGKLYVPVKNDMKALHTLSSSNQVDLAGRMVYNSKGVPVFNFGKFKNVPVVKVLSSEPNYYDWMMRGDFPQNTKQKLTEIKLSQFNKK